MDIHILKYNIKQRLKPLLYDMTDEQERAVNGVIDDLFEEIESLQHQNKDLENRNGNLRDEILNLQDEVDSLERRLEEEEW